MADECLKGGTVNGQEFRHVYITRKRHSTKCQNAANIKNNQVAKIWNNDYAFVLVVI
jgi:hypothetical protein